MKKFIVTILALIYLTATTGATVHLHYCMGELVELNLSPSETGKCGKCGMDKAPDVDNGCCKDEQNQVKVENDHYKSDVAFKAMDFVTFLLPISYTQIPPIILISTGEENLRSHAPPRSCYLAIYKRNCVFRI